LQLSAFSGNAFFMGHAAMLVNESLPNFIVDQLRPDALSEKSVAILGMAFKAESDDIRDSLSYKLKKLLQVAAREVLCSDPFVNDPALISAEEAVRRADIVILGAPHSEYRKLRIPEAKRVIDVWGFWKTQPQTSSRREPASVGA
jgi:UDP-N-acetyl-D-mannosaminuronic acid dehydrogenase